MKTRPTAPRFANTQLGFNQAVRMIEKIQKAKSPTAPTPPKSAPRVASTFKPTAVMQTGRGGGGGATWTKLAYRKTPLRPTYAGPIHLYSGAVPEPILKKPPQVVTPPEPTPTPSTLQPPTPRPLITQQREVLRQVRTGEPVTVRAKTTQQQTNIPWLPLLGVAALALLGG